MPKVLFTSPSLTLGVKEPTEFHGLAVTPADATALPDGPCSAIYTTGAGNVAGTLATGGTFLLTGLSAGQIVRINASIIASTNTTATGIYALSPAGNM